MSRNVLVLAEVRDGGLRNVSLECLAAARGGMYRLDKPSLPLYLVRN